MDRKRYSIINLLVLIVLLSLIIPNGSCETRSKISTTIIGPSCTIFTVAVGDTVLFGNNEDYLPRDLYQWYIPSQNISVMGGSTT